jgi:hypothetical protein
LYRRSRYGGWDDEDDDDNFGGDGADDYDLQELIESEITLDSWVDALGGRLANVGGFPSATTRYATSTFGATTSST